MATRVKIIGLTNFIRSESITIKKLSERQLRDMALNTQSVIRRKITESLQRPGSTGNLAKSFFAEKISGGWGIGNIAFLNTQAPYWRWINFGVAASGRTTPPRSVGTFTDGPPTADAFRGGRFIKGGGNFLMSPTKPIQPHNYIARTLLEVPKIIQSALTRIKR